MNPLVKIISDMFMKGLENFGRYYSAYRGFVISNEDPEGYGRLQLKVPSIYGDNIMTYWAWQKGTFSGPGYGSQVLPKKGDMVWVEFEMGSPRKPIWDYGHFSKTQGEKDKPEELRDPNTYWFKSPEGHLVIIDDTNNQVKVLHKDGLMLRLKEDNIFFGTNDANAQPITLATELKAQLDKTNSYLETLKTSTRAIAVVADVLVPGTSGIFDTAMATQVVGDYSNIGSEKTTSD